MLNIYATAFMVATRTDKPQLREIPSKTGTRGQRWFRRHPAHTITESDL